MLEYLHLKNVGPAPEMELELSPRLNLLTGDNGLGKSFLLDIAWWALTGRWPAEVNPMLTTGRMARPTGSHPASIEFILVARAPGPAQLVQVSKFERSAQAWMGVGDNRDHSALVLYAQVDGSFAVWDPARNAARSRGKGDAPDRLPAYVFAPHEVWDGLQPEPGKPPLCNGLIRDWARWQDGRGEAFKHLTTLLDALSPDPREKLEPGELTRISLDDARDIPTLRMPYGQDVPVLHASAGMRRIIALAYLLVWCWEEHVRASKLLGQPLTRQAVFLIDEIEAHLHPRWQRTITRALLEVVKNLSPQVGVQLIVATQSPLVMASVEPWFDGHQDVWYDLDLIPKRGGGHKVQLEKRDWVRHGDASRWLTSEAFDLRDAGSLEREEALAEAAVALSDEHFDREQARKLDARLREVLGDTDPFWMRWRFTGERRGWLS